MVPTFLYSANSPRLLLTVASAVSQHVPNLSHHVLRAYGGSSELTDAFVKRDSDSDNDHTTRIVFACLIPFLVLLSGVFAGLTLGYMSLDETQLNVLSISGTPDQKMYANRIKPIRKDGHLLLVTLLLANMIVNETLPVISDPVLGGGFQSVIVSTVLIVIFSEIIPQSLCTRYGLYFGAKMAGPMRVLLWTLGLVAWPVAKLLEFVLGPHHGIIYRRAELKELIAMHSNVNEYGGDLRSDTVAIIGGALDLQEKVVRQAMTPIEDVFMLSIDARLDYETLRKICLTGHSRVPVYEEIEMPVNTLVAQGAAGAGSKDGVEVSITEVPADSSTLQSHTVKSQKVKKIIGILLVKQCVLLDPKDATPIRKIPLNKVPFVPNNEPLLRILDRFQEGRSHMAIVSRFSVEQAVSVKKAVKRGLTKRLLDKVGMGDSSGSESESSSDEEDDGSISAKNRRRKPMSRKSTVDSDNVETLREEGDTDAEGGHTSSGSSDKKRIRFRVRRRGGKKRQTDIEMGVHSCSPSQEYDGANGKKQAQREGSGDSGSEPPKAGVAKVRTGMASLSLPKASFGRWEQSMPADAVLTKEGAEEFLQSVDPAIMPLGIITLEDVLEELIGEEIYDEFDPQGHPDLKSYAQNETRSVPTSSLQRKVSAPELSGTGNTGPSLSFSPSVTAASGVVPSNKDKDTLRSLAATPLIKPIALRGLNFRGLGFARSRSAPPIPRDEEPISTEKSEHALKPITVPEGAISDYSSGDDGSVDESKAAYSEANDQGVTTEAFPYSNNTYTLLTSFHMPPHPALAPDMLDNTPAISNVSRSNSRSKPSTPLRTPVPLPISPPAALIASPASGASPFTPALVAAPVPTAVSTYPSLLVPGVMHSRSASPAPSLEQAIMIERMRRATSGSMGVPVPKGARFKSSPLTGERNGLVVAEHVKQSMEGDHPTETEGGWVGTSGKAS